DEATLLNGAAVISVGFVLSPVVWEHHLTWLIFPTLVLTSQLHKVAEWAIFGVAFAVVYWMPTCDIYPISHLRTAAWICLVLLMVYASRQRGPSHNWTNSLTCECALAGE